MTQPYVASSRMEEASRDWKGLPFTGSTALSRHRFVSLVTGTYASATTTDRRVGVTKESTDNGVLADAIIDGEVMLECAENITVNDWVTSGANGKAMVATGGRPHYGLALTTGSTTCPARVLLIGFGAAGRMWATAKSGVSEGTGASQEIPHGGGKIPTYVLVVSEPKLKTASSAEATLTGSAQDVAHLFGSKPDAAWVDNIVSVGAITINSIDATNVNITGASDTGKAVRVHTIGREYPALTVTQGTHTATNMLLTATSGVPYRWFAFFD